jgi:hypothetical protein
LIESFFPAESGSLAVGTTLKRNGNAYQYAALINTKLLTRV